MNTCDGIKITVIYTEKIKSNEIQCFLCLLFLLFSVSSNWSQNESICWCLQLLEYQCVFSMSNECKLASVCLELLLFCHFLLPQWIHSSVWRMTKKTMEMKSQIDFYLFLCCFSTSFLCFVVDILPFHENNEEETRRSTLWRRCLCSRVDETTEQKSNILIAFMWVIMCMGVCVCLEATEQICFFCSCNFSKIHRFPFIMWI